MEVDPFDSAPEYHRFPYDNDDTLGDAQSITVRLTFISDHLYDVRIKTLRDEYVNKNRFRLKLPWKSSEAPKKYTAELIEKNDTGSTDEEREKYIISEGELPLEQIDANHRVHHLEESNDAYYRLTQETRSFHRDITIPFAAAGSLPMIVQCEQFASEENAKKNGQIAPIDVCITFPGLFEMKWEGDDRKYRFKLAGEDHDVDAKFIDSITFFESGYIGYSAAFIFRKSTLGSKNLINAAEILCLSLSAGSAGIVTGEVTRFRFGTSSPTGGDGPRLHLGAFLKQRLESLNEKADYLKKEKEKRDQAKQAREKTKRLWKTKQQFEKEAKRQEEVQEPEDNNLKNVFTLLLYAPNVKLGEILIKKIRAMEFLDHSKDQKKAPRQGHLSRMVEKGKVSGKEKPWTPNTKASVAVEVIKADKHMCFLEAARNAGKRAEPKDLPFARRLAGLAQNVFDFDAQDSAEIHDSLGSSFIFGLDAHFCGPNMSIRFSESSRSYESKWAVVGGEPYWFLVELVIAHNARLLIDLNERVRTSQGMTGISQRLYHIMNLAERDPTSPEERKAVEDRNSRQILFAHFLPNVFRYPIEKLLYKNFSKARGLNLQYKNFEYFDSIIERVRRDAELHQKGVVEDRVSKESARLSTLLFVIGIIQTVGVFAAFASIFVGIAVSDNNYALFGHDLLHVLSDKHILNILQAYLDGKPEPQVNSEFAFVPAAGIMLLSASFLFFFIITSFEKRAWGSWDLFARTGFLGILAAFFTGYYWTARYDVAGVWILAAAAVGLLPILASYWWHRKPIPTLILGSKVWDFVSKKWAEIMNGPRKKADPE